MILFRNFSFFLGAAAASLSFNALAQSSGASMPTAASPAPAVASTPAADNTVLMRGPAGEVTLGQVRAAVQVIIPAQQRERFFENPRNIEQLALSVYTRQALAAQAKQQGFDQQPDMIQALEVAKIQFIGDSWLEHLAKKAEPTSEQLEKYARSVFDAQPSRKTADGKTVDFESQRAPLMEQARAKLVNQARADAWNAAKAGAEPVVDAIAAQVIAPAEK